VLCLPPAGSGCGQFRLWQDALGDRVSVVGVQLPGRETRWRDPSPACVDDAVAAIVDEVRSLVPEQPLVVFGHSFGGLLGYEIARVLGNRYDAWPAALVVAACRPPHMWIGAGHGLASDDDALARLFNGRDLDDDELDEDSRELFLEVLRKDTELSLTYRDPQRSPVHCELWAWGGDRDDIVVASDLAGWRDYAAEEFMQLEFAGGHYFPGEQLDRVLQELDPLRSDSALGRALT
jgi:surfactin synthase thioesterase subunit